MDERACIETAVAAPPPHGKPVFRAASASSPHQILSATLRPLRPESDAALFIGIALLKEIFQKILECRSGGWLFRLLVRAGRGLRFGASGILILMRRIPSVRGIIRLPALAVGQKNLVILRDIDAGNRRIIFHHTQLFAA